MTLHFTDVSGLVTVQDAGRRGLAHLGVPRAGWLDPAAARLANRLVGNHEDAALLEATLAALRVSTTSGAWIAVTGAECVVRVDGAVRSQGRAEWVSAGSELSLGAPVSGVRSYLAVAGGIAVEPVLGSRSTDTLAWVGPPRIEAGTSLPVGRPDGPPAAVDTVRPPPRGPLRVDSGPRADWFGDDVIERLCATSYVVTTESNRIGLRLDGTPLPRVRDGELASEGMVLGAVQVPPNGLPVVFLADHPTTGGYPVVAVVRADDLAQCAQLRPGDDVRFKAS